MLHFLPEFVEHSGSSREERKEGELLVEQLVVVVTMEIKVTFENVKAQHSTRFACCVYIEDNQFTPVIANDAV